MTQELRCPSKMHGILMNGNIEVKCSSRFCGAAKGVVVLHTFDGDTGKLIGTERYRDFVQARKEQGI